MRPGIKLSQFLRIVPTYSLIYFAFPIQRCIFYYHLFVFQFNYAAMTYDTNVTDRLFVVI